jgi:phosphatidylglycerol---prolipoprotein diacylglyceryl transferase
MGPYGFWWSAGAAVGAMVAVAYLARRAIPVRRGLVLVAIAFLAFVVGSKLQHRLEHLPFHEAVAMGPWDLVAPGLRLPLGLVIGLAGAAFIARLLGYSFRLVGDALAACACVAIVMGRIGCFTVGCCSGVVCSAWPTSLCVRYPPTTEAYGMQRLAGQIEETAARSKPVHPLQAYYQLVGLSALAVFVLLRRRQAPDGLFLATYACISAGSRLLLEPLRATRPATGGMMFVVPITVLSITSATLLAVWCIRRIRGHMMSRAPGVSSRPPTLVG